MKDANKLAKSGARTDNSNCSRSSAPSSLSRFLSLSLSLALSMSLSLFLSPSLAFVHVLFWTGSKWSTPNHTRPPYIYHISYHVISCHVILYTCRCIYTDTPHTHTHMHAGTHEHAHSRVLYDIAVGLRGGRGLHRSLDELALVGIDLGGNCGQLLLDEVAQCQDLLHATLASLLKGLSSRWLDHLL